MITVKEIKVSMRISHDYDNDEIDRNIETCLLDMNRVGVDGNHDCLLLGKACELYCKWQMDYNGKGDVYQKRYESLRDSMSLTEEYRCTKKESS